MRPGIGRSCFCMAAPRCSARPKLIADSPARLLARAGVASFVLDYPLAPEEPFPAASEAAIAARRWLGAKGIAQIALVGDSAGGALALGALGPAADGPAVAAVAVFSPWTDLALTGGSFTSPDTYDPIFQPQILAGAASDLSRRGRSSEMAARHRFTLFPTYCRRCLFRSGRMNCCWTRRGATPRRQQSGAARSVSRFSRGCTTFSSDP